MALILELLLKLHICDFLFCFVGFYVMAGSVCLRNLSPKATSSEEERSSGGSQFFNEKRDGVIILEDVKEDNNKNEFDKTVIEDTKQDLFDDDGQGLSFDLLDKLNVRLTLTHKGILAMNLLVQGKCFIFSMLA